MKILALTLGTMLLIPTFTSAQQFGWGGRKQTNVALHQQGCHCESCRKPKKFCRVPGFNGHPYRDPVHNGCKCNRPCGKLKSIHFTPHWPAPFANMERYTPHYCSPGKQPRDVFDVLAHVKLIHFKRRDNGYRGLYCDPHGKLGESFTGGYQPPQQLGPAPAIPPKSQPDNVANRYSYPRNR